MTEHDPANLSAADLSDPTIAAARLAEIAQARHDLWPLILQHPNVYPGLSDWIIRQQPTQHASQQPQAPAAMTAETWAAGFLQANGREATMGEYQAALAAGHIRKPVDPNIQHMTEGAKQLASGAKDFFREQVAPAAAGAVRNVQQAVNEQAQGQRRGTATWLSWAPFAVPATAALMIISLLFPVGNIMGQSFTFFHRELGGEGIWLLIGMLLVLGAGIFALVSRKRWATITTGVLALLLAVMGLYDGFGNAGNLNSLPYGSAGPGAVLLGLLSLVLLLAAVLTLIPARFFAARPAGSHPGTPEPPTPQTPNTPQD